MSRVCHTVGMPAVLFLCSRLQRVGLSFQEGVAAGLLLLLLWLRARGAGLAVAILCTVSLLWQLSRGPYAEIKLCLAFGVFGTEEVWQVVIGKIFAG